jgi:hypothetical protein
VPPRADVPEGKDYDNYSDLNLRQLWHEARRDHAPDSNHEEKFQRRANELMQDESINMRERQGWYNTFSRADKMNINPPQNRPAPTMMERAADYARRIGEHIAPTIPDDQEPEPDIFDRVFGTARQYAGNAADALADRAERERLRLQSAAAKVSDVVAPRRRDDDDWGRPKPEPKITPKFDPRIHDWKPSDMSSPDPRLMYLSDSDEDDNELSPAARSMQNSSLPDEVRAEAARPLSSGFQALRGEPTEDPNRPMSANPKAKILRGVTGINKMKLKDFQDIRHIDGLIPEERGALQSRAEELFADKKLPYGQRASTRRFLDRIGLKNLDELPEDKESKTRGGTFGLAGKNFYSDEPESDDDEPTAKETYPKPTATPTATPTAAESFPRPESIAEANRRRGGAFANHSLHGLEAVVDGHDRSLQERDVRRRDDRPLAEKLDENFESYKNRVNEIMDDTGYPYDDRLRLQQRLKSKNIDVDDPKIAREEPAEPAEPAAAASDFPRPDESPTTEDNPFKDFTYDELREISNDEDAMNAMSPDELDHLSRAIDERESRRTAAAAASFPKPDDEPTREPEPAAPAPAPTVEPKLPAAADFPRPDEVPTREPEPKPNPEFDEARNRNASWAADVRSLQHDLRRRQREYGRLDFDQFHNVMSHIPDGRLEREEDNERRALGKVTNDFLTRRDIPHDDRASLARHAVRAGLGGIDAPATTRVATDVPRRKPPRSRPVDPDRYISPYEAATRRMRAMGMPVERPQKKKRRG